jgi:hypothetical protein
VGGYGWLPTIARFEVEYDSVKDACDIILNTNNVFGASNTVAQGQMQTWDGHVHTGSWRPQDVIDQKIEDGKAGLPDYPHGPQPPCELHQA